MIQPLIECVPNFSEGRDESVIRAIAEAISLVEGATLLNVDPGKSTNRTVYTFAGAPAAVCEAAFQAAKVGTERIDMARHHGEHPRFGALDVCPLVPIAGISMEEVAELARGLGSRLGDELGLSVFLYGEAAACEERRELSSVRSGEYEGLPERLQDPAWKPDFGPATLQPKSGATAVGARDFLIAYNVNLNTTSSRRANAVAFDIRERGRALREGDPLTGKIVRDASGDPVHKPGALKNTKAIGWFIEEYGFAQVSINLTNLRDTPLHEVYDTCCEKAGLRGLRVTGSELIGLVPLGAMLAAGRYFLKKQKRSTGVPDSELIRIAAKTMGLDELAPFDPDERIIERALRDRGITRLVDLDVERFTYKVASESPAPGGGSVAALAGALGAALGAMVANLSSHKRGWDARWEEFSDWAERGQACCDELLRLVDEDTRAFDQLMAAFRLPKGSDEELAAQKEAVQRRTEDAMQVPLLTMEASLRSMEVLAAMASEGNPNSVSDAGVGALCARAAVRGAFLNVQINSAGVEDRVFVDRLVKRATEIDAEATKREDVILAIVHEKFRTAQP